MGEYADQLVDQEMFGSNYNENHPKRKAWFNRTPAEMKIASIRKEIAILVNDKGVSLEEARKQMNTKYGKGWRERGLTKNSDNQWTEEELSNLEVIPNKTKKLSAKHKQTV